MSRCIVIEEAGTKSLSSNGSQNRDPTNSGTPQTTFSNVDRRQPRKCPNCQSTHYGSSQLGIFCPECEHDKITSGELDLPTKPQYSNHRETW